MGWPWLDLVPVVSSSEQETWFIFHQEGVWSLLQSEWGAATGHQAGRRAGPMRETQESPHPPAQGSTTTGSPQGTARTGMDAGPQVHVLTSIPRLCGLYTNYSSGVSQGDIVGSCEAIHPRAGLRA